MFDLKKMAVKWETNVKNGVCVNLLLCKETCKIPLLLVGRIF